MLYTGDSKTPICGTASYSCMQNYSNNGKSMHISYRTSNNKCF